MHFPNFMVCLFLSYCSMGYLQSNPRHLAGLTNISLLGLKNGRVSKMRPAAKNNFKHYLRPN